MEYFSESGVLENVRVRYHFRYPIGEPFGDFYRELAKACRGWLDREYSEYQGRGITYRSNALITYSEEGITSVTLDISLFEKGTGDVKRRFSSQNWLADGRILPLFALKDKNMQKSFVHKVLGYFVSGGEIYIFDEKGQKFATGVKYGKLCQEILPNNLKNRS